MAEFVLMSSLLASVFVTFLLIIYWKCIRQAKSMYDILHRQGIPGEPFVPILGQLVKVRQSRAKNRFMIYVDDLQKTHGNIFHFGFGPFIYLFINDPDMIANIFNRSHAQNYTRTSELTNVLKQFLGPHNLFVTEGKEHEWSRKLMNPAFHFANFQSMVPIMSQETDKFIDKLLELSSSSKDNTPVDLYIQFQSLTLSIIVLSCFGKSIEITDDKKQSFCQAFTQALQAILYRSTRMIDKIPFLAKLPFWRKNLIDAHTQEIDHFIDQIINERKNDKTSCASSMVDLLDLLLSVVDSEGQPMSDEIIKEHILGFIFAGHETTGNLIAWTMYILMTNESVLEACRKEVDQVLSDGIELTYKETSKLVVCEAVLQETLRLYPPVPFLTRHSASERMIGNIGENQLHIPAGTNVVICPWLLHRLAEFWPRPLEFDYTRWLRDPVTGLKPKLAHRFCYLPFAAGAHNCIGRNFALLEAKIVLAQLVKRCRFDLEPDQIIVPEVRLTLRPKYGLLARVNKR